MALASVPHPHTPMHEAKLKAVSQSQSGASRSARRHWTRHTTNGDCGSVQSTPASALRPDSRLLCKRCSSPSGRHRRTLSARPPRRSRCAIASRQPLSTPTHARACAPPVVRPLPCVVRAHVQVIKAANDAAGKQTRAYEKAQDELSKQVALMKLLLYGDAGEQRRRLLAKSAGRV